MTSKNKRDHHQFLGEVRARVTRKYLQYKSVTECGAIRYRPITVNDTNERAGGTTRSGK
jgi:hypothetical protein